MPAARATSFRVTAVIRCNIGDVSQTRSLNSFTCLATVHEPRQSRAAFLRAKRASVAEDQALNEPPKTSHRLRRPVPWRNPRGSPLLEDHLDSLGLASQE